MSATCPHCGAAGESYFSRVEPMGYYWGCCGNPDSPEALISRLAQLREQNAKLTKERDDAIAALKEPWEDKRDEWSDRIDAAHPVNTNDHRRYEVALEMVSNRNGKYELVDLVNWLMKERNELQIRVNDLEPMVSELFAERDMVRTQRDTLQAWKDDAQLVENEWKPQVIANLLGITLGSSIRANIEPRIRELIARVEQYRECARTAIALMCELNWPTEGADVFADAVADFEKLEELEGKA